MSDTRRLRDLARDVIEAFRCDCVDKNGNEPRRCPCGGDGTDVYGNAPAPHEGCWNCQAKAALRRPRRPTPGKP